MKEFNLKVVNSRKKKLDFLMGNYEQFIESLTQINHFYNIGRYSKKMLASLLIALTGKTFFGSQEYDNLIMSGISDEEFTFKENKSLTISTKQKVELTHLLTSIIDKTGKIMKSYDYSSENDNFLNLFLTLATDVQIGHIAKSTIDNFQNLIIDCAAMNLTNCGCITTHKAESIKENVFNTKAVVCSDNEYINTI